MVTKLKIVDHTGKKLGRLTVLGYAYTENKRKMWKCVCTCGNITYLPTSEITRGRTQSCGCYALEVQKRPRPYQCKFKGTRLKDGRTRISSIWKGMMGRCYNKSYKGYKNYGGRNIQVCPEWHNPLVFQEWAFANGYADDLTLDRIDNNGDYCPENCRWITMFEQSQNRRNCVYLEYQGKRQTLSSWARELNVSEQMLGSRLKADWPVEDLLFTPSGQIPNFKKNTIFIILDYKGESHGIPEWAKITGIPASTIRWRYHKGWFVEDILTKPTK